jgi:hypothetical protein
MFNNIIFVRKNRLTGAELERQRVPIMYAPKEKYFARLENDPDLTKELQVTLPRMSFEITGISYDANRKLNSLLKNPKASTASKASSQYMGVPYDLNFELNIYTRNVDDGTQIVEQILPYFNPDYTVTINSVPEMGFLKDVPIILNTVSNNIEHEGNFDAVRYVTWRLEFTMKGYYYGPVATTNIIRTVETNIYNDPSIVSGYITKMNLANGNSGIFNTGDIVFQGTNYRTASAYGTVLSWNPTNEILELGGVQGQFYVNNSVRAVSSNANYSIASFDTDPLKLVKITIVPDPVTADPDDDYGYDTTIEEWPNITE